MPKKLRSIKMSLKSGIIAAYWIGQGRYVSYIVGMPVLKLVTIAGILRE